MADRAALGLQSAVEERGHRGSVGGIADPGDGATRPRQPGADGRSDALRGLTRACHLEEQKQLE